MAVPEFDFATWEVLDHTAAVVVFELGDPGAVFSEDVGDLVSGDGGPGSRGVDVLGRGDLHSYSFRACVRVRAHACVAGVVRSLIDTPGGGFGQLWLGGWMY